jgi:hypothetical protein
LPIQESVAGKAIRSRIRLPHLRLPPEERGRPLTFVRCVSAWSRFAEVISSAGEQAVYARAAYEPVPATLAEQDIAPGSRNKGVSALTALQHITTQAVKMRGDLGNWAPSHREG